MLIRLAVALHPEGVDRNNHDGAEIPFDQVALHPEGVDRNNPTPRFRGDMFGRPPPGGRG